jgi:hypothetical protein
MQNNKLLKQIAELIWDSGTQRLHYITPGDFVSDFIIDRYSATHYILSWAEKGKIVKITFFKADKFGPTKNLGEILLEEIVEI